MWLCSLPVGPGVRSRRSTGWVQRPLRPVSTCGGVDPHLLRTFVAVLDHRSFSAAASALGYARSAVSCGCSRGWAPTGPPHRTRAPSHPHRTRQAPGNPPQRVTRPPLSLVGHRGGGGLMGMVARRVVARPSTALAAPYRTAAERRPTPGAACESCSPGPDNASASATRTSAPSGPPQATWRPVASLDRAIATLRRPNGRATIRARHPANRQCGW